MGYAKPSVVKCELGITDKSRDADVARWIRYADSIIDEECGQSLILHDVEEYLCGNGTDTLVLSERFVNAVTEVAVDSSGVFGDNVDGFPASTIILKGSQYALRKTKKNEPSKSGILYRVDGVWPAISQRHGGSILGALTESRGNIRVKYTAGFSEIPADLEHLANQLVCIQALTKGTGGEMSSFSLEGFSQSLGSSVSKDSGSFLLNARKTLSRYAKWVV